MNNAQKNLVFGLLMGTLLTVNLAGLLFFTDHSSIGGIIATGGRIAVLVLMSIAAALFFVASGED